MHYFLHALLHAWQKRYRGFKFIFVRILRMKIYGLVNVGKNTKKGTSSTNLLNHIRALHSEFERMRKSENKEKTDSCSAYLQPTFILPTSDMVERFLVVHVMHIRITVRTSYL